MKSDYSHLISIHNDFFQIKTMGSTKKSGSTPEAKYKLVLFKSNDKKKGKESIDIVPINWIYWDTDSDEFRAKFMPEESYRCKGNLELLNKMVKNCDEPSSNWPSYAIEIRGRARTYEEAEVLADKLQYQPYAYSTDNEKSAKKKAKEDEDFIKTNRQESVSTANDLLNAANVNLSTSFSKSSGKKSRGVKCGKGSSSTAKKNDAVNKLTDIDNCSGLKRTRESSDSEKSSSYDDNYDRPKRNRESSVSDESSESIDKAVINKNKKSKKSRKSKSQVSNEDDSDSDTSKTTLSSKPKFSQRSQKPKNNNNFVKGKADGNMSTDASNQHSTPESDKEYAKIYMNKEMLTQVLSKLLIPIVNEQKSFGAQLSSLSKTVNDMKGNLIQTQRICEKNNASSMIMEAEFDTEGINLPCPDLDEFNKLEKKLSEHANYRNTIAYKLTSLVNTNQAIIRSTTPMIRFLMSRDLAMTFNLKKPNATCKNIFITTKCYDLIKGILVRKFTRCSDDPLPDATINNSLQSVFNHCGDWEGGRNERKKKRIEKVDDSAGKSNGSDTPIS